MQLDTVTPFAAILAFAIIGLYLLGGGITGRLVSETCCYGPSCEAEKLCDVSRPHMETPLGVDPDSAMIYAGIALLGISGVAILALTRRNRQPVRQ